MDSVEQEAVIRMVTESAQTICPEELDFVDEYAFAVRSSASLPSSSAATRDTTSAPFMSSHDIGHVGLLLLGAIAKETLVEIRKKMVEKGVNSAWELLSKKTVPNKEAEDVANTLAVRLTLPKEVQLSNLQLIVNLQMQGLATAPEVAKNIGLPTPPISSGQQLSGIKY